MQVIIRHRETFNRERVSAWGYKTERRMLFAAQYTKIDGVAPLVAVPNFRFMCYFLHCTHVSLTNSGQNYLILKRELKIVTSQRQNCFDFGSNNKRKGRPDAELYSILNTYTFKKIYGFDKFLLFFIISYI